MLDSGSVIYLEKYEAMNFLINRVRKSIKKQKMEQICSIELDMSIEYKRKTIINEKDSLHFDYKRRK